MIDWLVVGGGIHGCTIAHSLLRYGRVRREKMMIVDPNPRLLAAWHLTTHACGMRFMRSPAAHALVPDFTALLGWARRHGYERDLHTTPPYARPSLELFNAHAHATLRSSGLPGRLRRASVVGISLDRGNADCAHSWRLALDSGEEMRARNVVLAPGRSDGLNIPDWAQRDPRAVHVFDPTFNRARLADARRPVIVGGGVSAVHLALFLARAGSGGRARRADAPVTLVMRHELRVRQFDSDPCYLGPACMQEFLALETPQERRERLRRVRNPGSVPPDLADELRRVEERGAVRIQVREPHEPADLDGDAIVLATGFAAGPPLAAIVARLADGDATGMPLPVDPAGYPVPLPTLEWAPGLYVTGALGEQELGPAAVNIVGAHNAAKRIIGHRSGRLRRIPAAWPRYAPESASSSPA